MITSVIQPPCLNFSNDVMIRMLMHITSPVPWIANWLKLGGRNLGRPTHFEVRDGNY